MSSLAYLGPALGVLLGLFALFKVEDRSRRWVMMVAAVLILQGAWNAWLAYSDNRRSLAEAHSGNLKNPTRTWRNSEHQFLDVRIGCSGTVFRVQLPHDAVAVWPLSSLPFGGGLDLAVSGLPDSLRVSATIRNLRDDVVAVLRENEWETNPNRIFRRNFDATALEVVDNRGDVVLQIDLRAEEMRIAGLFLDNRGSGFALSGPPGGSAILKPIPDRRHVTELPQISPLFRYPADTHLGERRKDHVCDERQSAA